MTTTFLRSSTLPPVLQAYVNGEVHTMPKGAFTTEEIRLTVWLRKGFLRRAQYAEPGIQYVYPDYERLMRGEITTFSKRTMEKLAFEKFEELLENSLRLKAIFTDEMERRCRHYKHISEAKLTHIKKETMRTTFRYGIQDPRTLGEMELFLLGRIHYGMPHSRNYQAGDDNH
jgi:hypothetical protein